MNLGTCRRDVCAKFSVSSKELIAPAFGRLVGTLLTRRHDVILLPFPSSTGVIRFRTKKTTTGQNADNSLGLGAGRKVGRHPVGLSKSPIPRDNTVNTRGVLNS